MNKHTTTLDKCNINWIFQPSDILKYLLYNPTGRFILSTIVRHNSCIPFQNRSWHSDRLWIIMVGNATIYGEVYTFHGPKFFPFRNYPIPLCRFLPSSLSFFFRFIIFMYFSYEIILVSCCSDFQIIINWIVFIVF